MSKETPLELIARLNAEAGRVRCDRCSTPDWEVYHAPDKCPLETEVKEFKAAMRGCITVTNRCPKCKSERTNYLGDSQHLCFDCAATYTSVEALKAQMPKD